MERPHIKPHDQIRVGKNSSVRAIVSCASATSAAAVWYDRPNRVVEDEIQWVEDHWEFKDGGGAYARDNPRLTAFVSDLNNWTFGISPR